MPATVTEQLRIVEVCRRFPSPSGKPRSVQAVVRWITDGYPLRDRNGKRVGVVRLKAKRVGRSWYTTEADLARFIERMTQAYVTDDADEAQSETEPQDLDAINAACEAAGI